MAGYAISADVMGEQVRDNLPNMGVMAHRRFCNLLATNRNLGFCLGCCARVAKETDFEWQLTPGTTENDRPYR